MQNNLISRFKSKFFNDIHLKEILKGSFIAFVFRIFGMGLGYIFILFIARWYGAEAVGSFSLSFTLLHIFVTIGVFGFDNALVKFIADYNSNDNPHLVKEIYTKSLFVTIPLAIILSVFLYHNANFFAVNVFKNETLEVFFQITSYAIVPFVLLRINGGVFRGLKDIKHYSWTGNPGIYLVSVVILLIASIKDFDSTITIISQCVAIGVMMLVSFIYIKKHTYIFRTISQNILRYKEILKVSLPMLLTSSMTLVMGWTDIIMLGVFMSEEEVGVYSVVVKIAVITSIFLMAINTIAAPKFSELYSKRDMEGLKNIAQSSTKMIFYSTLPIILVLTLFPKFILGIFGEDFIIGIGALWILMFGQLVNTITGSVGLILNMTGKQVLFNKIIIFSSIVNIVLNYFFIQIYGVIGAALSTTISICFLHLTPFFFVKHYYGFYTFNISNLLRSK